VIDDLLDAISNSIRYNQILKSKIKAVIKENEEEYKEIDSPRKNEALRNIRH
jgi:hypothetical protein